MLVLPLFQKIRRIPFYSGKDPGTVLPASGRIDAGIGAIQNCMGQVNRWGISDRTSHWHLARYGAFRRQVVGGRKPLLPPRDTSVLSGGAADLHDSFAQLLVLTLILWDLLRAKA